MNQYRLVKKIGEGAFAEVLQAKNLKTGKYVAIKCMKNHFKSREQVNSLPEIYALKKLCPKANPNPNIVQLNDALYDEPTGRLALVFELMDMNMYEVIKGRRSYIQEKKLLKAIYHMHKNGIFHRDIKPENILIQNDDVIKLADFGSCRGIYSKQPYTEYISTRWYRPPECLLTDGYYNKAMDLWGFGCVFFEMLALHALFPGTPPPKTFKQFQKYASQNIFGMKFPQKKGTGLKTLIPRVSKECIDLLEQLLAYSPEQRLTAKQAIKHYYFSDLYEQDKQQYKLNLKQMNQLRGSSQEREDGQSSRNSSQSNINVNMNSSLNSGYIQNPKNKMKKRSQYPYIQHSGHSSDSDEGLPSIHNKYDYGSYYKKSFGYKRKNSGKIYLNDFTSVGGKQKRMGKKKKYVSPYSQKAILSGLGKY